MISAVWSNFFQFSRHQTSRSRHFKVSFSVQMSVFQKCYFTYTIFYNACNDFVINYNLNATTLQCFQRSSAVTFSNRYGWHTISYRTPPIGRIHFERNRSNLLGQANIQKMQNSSATSGERHSWIPDSSWVARRLVTRTAKEP